MQAPKIIECVETTLVGICIQMSFFNDRTSELWRAFGSKVGEIKERVGTERYSVKVYDENYSFSTFDPEAMFEKWAAVETSDHENVSEGFEALTIPAGKYAMFNHRGTPAKASETFGYIFGTWLPNSTFYLDSRPHFEILGEDYSPFNDDAEETIWIPIKDRQGENL